MGTGQNEPSGLPDSAAALYRAALGPVVADTYLPVIARFEQRGRPSMAWNARAALGQVAWLVYWRLWGVALAQAGLVLAVAAALGWLWLRADGVPAGIRTGLTVSALVLLGALPGLWGMAWLHRGLRRRVSVAVRAADSLTGALDRLGQQEQAWRVPGLLAAVAAMVMTAALAGLAWQQARRPAAPVAQAPTAPGVPTAARTAEPAPAATLVDLEVAAAAPVAPSPTVPLSPPTEPLSPPTEPPSPPAVAPAQATAAAPVESAPRAMPAAALSTPAGESQIRPRPRGFGVNVGMFAVAANAERTMARLADAGLPVLANPIESARGPLTRVRVGPFERRDQAEQAAAQVRALGLEARVYAP